MNRWRWAAVVLLASSGCSLFRVPEPVPVQGRPAEGGIGRSIGARPAPVFEDGAEVRGLWVVRTTMTTPERVRAMVERASGGGYNAILVQVRGRSDAFYRSSLEPISALIQPPDFDPLELTVRLARDEGLTVHAWVNLHLAWSGTALPRSREHVVRARPEWLAVPRGLAGDLHRMEPSDPRYLERLLRYASENSDQVEGVYLSPSHPGAKAWLLAVATDIATNYDLDGVHFDYVRLPQREFDHAASSLERFAVWVRPRLDPQATDAIGLLNQGDLPGLVGALPREWADFQRDAITETVRWIYHALKARKPELTVSAAVRADMEDARVHRYQDWGAWLDEGIIDAVVPMAYTSSRSRFRELVDDAVRAAGEERTWAGLGVYLNSTEETLAQVDLARAAGVAGFVLFSYDWAVGEGYSGSGPTLLQLVADEKFR